MSVVAFDIEAQIHRWRDYLARHQAISADDIDELEDHLREQHASLLPLGLSDDEAFVVALRRLGNLDALSAEYARVHGDRLWKQLDPSPTRFDLVPVVALALLAGLVFRSVVWLVGESGLIDTDASNSLILRNAALVIAPFLMAYFVWKRRLGVRITVLLALTLVVAGVMINLWPGGSEEGDVSRFLHGGVLLWMIIGTAYASGRWHSLAHRMDAVRFTGEFTIYVTLLVLGGVVMTALTAASLAAAGVMVDVDLLIWMASLGFPAAMVVAIWLVERKQSVIENLAPVLTRVFTPLTTVMLIALLVTLVLAGNLTRVDRDLLLTMDVILVLVAALVLYALSARAPERPADTFDILQLIMVLTAIVLDLVLLAAMVLRIADAGITENKLIALGLNLTLLAHLSGHAVLTVRFLRGQTGAAAWERWQTGYLPVYAAWALAVLLVIPLIFRGVSGILG